MQSYDRWCLSYDCIRITFGGMEQLFDLIRRELRARRLSQEDFAAQLGVRRQSIRGWNHTMPTPERMRAIATSLELPYAQVLAAGLSSAGYVESLSDLLTGHTVYSVAACDGGYDRSEPQAVAVFTTESAAERFCRASEIAHPGDDYVSAAQGIDTCEPPELATVYETMWTSTGGITQHERQYGQIPPGLRTSQVSEVRAAWTSAGGPAHVQAAGSASSHADRGKRRVYRLVAESLDPAAGHETIQSALGRLARHDQLLAGEIVPPRDSFGLPPNYTPLPAGDGNDLPVEEPWLAADLGPSSYSGPLTGPQHVQALRNLIGVPYRWGGFKDDAANGGDHDLK